MVQLLTTIADSNWLKNYIHQSIFYPGSGSDFQIMFDVPRGILPTAKWVFVDYGGQPNEEDHITMACGNEGDLHSFQGASGYEKVGGVIDITELFRRCYTIDIVPEGFPQKILYSIYYNEREKHAIQAIFLMGFEAINSYKILYNHPRKNCALFLLKEGLGTKYSQHTKWHTLLEAALEKNPPEIIVYNDGPYGHNQYNKCVTNHVTNVNLRVGYQQLGLETINIQEMTVFKVLEKKKLIFNDD